MADDELQVVPQGDEQALREAALKRIRARRDFHSHLISFVLVNLLLWAIWLVMGFTSDWWWPWPVFPTFGWGIGIGMHAWSVYGRGEVTEGDVRREMDRLRA